MDFMGDLFKKLSVAIGVSGALTAFLISLSIWLFYDKYLHNTLSGDETKGLICTTLLVVLTSKLFYSWIKKNRTKSSHE